MVVRTEGVGGSVVVVQRTRPRAVPTQTSPEAAATQFDGMIRTAREEAARRLARELDLAVERFAREAESVLAERVESELRIFEARLTEISRRLDSLSARA